MRNRKQKRYIERWLDTTYQGREHELVTTAEIAAMAGAGLSTVIGWRRRYEDFPEPVKEVETGSAPTKYFVATEATAWLAERAPGNREKAKARLAAFAIDVEDDIDALRQQLRHLEHMRDQVRKATGQKSEDTGR